MLRSDSVFYSQCSLAPAHTVEAHSNIVREKEHIITSSAGMEIWEWKWTLIPVGKRRDMRECRELIPEQRHACQNIILRRLLIIDNIPLPSLSFLEVVYSDGILSNLSFVRIRR